MRNFDVVPGISTTTGGKLPNGEIIETITKRYKIRNNHTLEVLPKLYESYEEAQSECDRLNAE
ncbi:hypothetical protein [Pseudomonas helleri]|uniref:hypothetical protein n=1 Tax=Pseudomonas helleri TaxID=1608996 RepID=UPI0006538544|nr:hypothetical protein [Pseudomonas helleri]KMN06762.1 hypothetical protein TU84_19355 [Pseudomonas helleri]